jgi:hypothetical protein
MMTAMDDEIWPKLTGLMGRVPLPDGSTQCNGGSPEFDVYVTPVVARSYAAAYFPPGCRATPSYIVLNPGVSDAILAHEFMHSLQWSYNTSADCMYPGEYAWLAEATASWSQNYVYPASNEEHTYVPWFYNGGSGGEPPSLDLRNDSHEYGAHVFFFYLTHHFGQPEIVRTAWDNTTSMKSLPAVDKAIPGGIDAVWGDFAVENMVEPPNDQYQTWDQLNVKPSGSSLTEGKTAANTTYEVADQINYLSIKYVRFTFSEDSRLVTFFNGLSYKLEDEPINTYMGTLPINDGTTQYKFTAISPEDSKGIKIQAYFKIAGETDWQVEDWTGKPYVSFCRDAQSERLSDLIIITSNSAQDYGIVKTGAYGSRLAVSDIGCWRYGGDASLLSTGAGEGGKYTDQQTIPNVAFERTEVHPNIPYPILHFKVAEGQVDRTYNYTASNDPCVGNGKSNVSLTKSSGPSFGNDLFILYGAMSGPSVRRYSGSANSKENINVTFQGCDGAPSAAIPPQNWFAADILSQLLKKSYLVPTGGTFEGSDNMLEEVSDAQMTYKWHFESLSESGSSGGAQSDSDPSQPPAGDPSTSPGSDSSVPQSPQTAGSSDVPKYPNATDLPVQNASGMLLITTTDSQEKVAQFYRDQLTAQGWIDGSTAGNSSADLISLFFAKDTKLISIMISTKDGTTTIMIKEIGQ